MVWFRVDDAFYRGKKVRRLGTEHRVAAVGLWTLAGSWSADNLTDGFVPREVTLGWDNEGYLCKTLVDAELWSESTQDGEPGHQFHDWAEWQMSREDIEKKRSDQRERVRRYRERQAAKGSPEDQSGNALRNAATHPLVTEPPYPYPYQQNVGGTASDPTLVDHVVNFSPGGGEKTAEPTKRKKATEQRGARIPADFSVDSRMVQWAMEKTPNVDGRHETEQFKDFWTAADGPRASKRDWVAAWRTWMRNAEKRIAERSMKKPSAADGWDSLKNADE